MPRLTPQEQREIIRYIEQDKPLPEKYRFLLFDDKREVELVWNGKTNEVCNVVLPFQTIEQVDEPRAEKPAALQLSLLDVDARGRQLKGWTNKLIWGDNKLILSSLKSGPLRDEIEKQGGLKLIYIDPPFDVGADFSMDIEIGDDTFTKKPGILEEIAYRDTWGRGADSFLAMIYERLKLMHELLANDGSIYVHCDWRMVGALRLIMDEIFGNFENVVSWKRSAIAAGVKAQWRNSQDFILFFSKTGIHTFNPQFGKYSESSKKHYSYQDENGIFQPVPLLASGRSNGETGSIWKGIDPNRLGKNGMHWLKRINILDELDAKGLIYWPEKDGGTPRLKYYLGEAKGVYISDFWDDINVINSMADEYQNYMTQKPEALLERIIKASSNEGDLVADFFCGSGTTAAVAEKLGRKWIATDLGKFAIHTTRKRMIGVQRQLKKDGRDYRAFEILNLGKYERQHYVGVNEDLREEEKQRQLAAREAAFLELILRAYRAEKAEGFTTFHGKRAGRMVVVGPVNLPVTRLFVEEIILECRKHHVTKVDILGFEFEMGLFPNVLDEARGKGIDISPKYIPAEVFDKRAVEKNQVVFHDVSFIEVKPHYHKNSVAVELTDFSVFYSQDSIAAAESALKEKSSKIVVEKGQIVKVSKDKNGIVTREPLTRHWTDWIDYWSVDFDFESKREIIRVKNPDSGEVEELWTGDFIFENEWQSFRTRKDRKLELKSVFHELPGGRHKVAVKVVDIFGNDTMTILEVNVGGKK
ncbi:DNA methyltransferase [uncultured Desulfovibrio sp.]|uniref:site-specific DNA-methyltransferase n=1 Tax=uncultured Desulfovibrio sp. TaxID=167968 RepID=UPI0026205959|nr:DNA methyltransferase [uncultured Desulfovibrio sp.]